MKKAKLINEAQNTGLQKTCNRKKFVTTPSPMYRLEMTNLIPGCGWKKIFLIKEIILIASKRNRPNFSS